MLTQACSCCHHNMSRKYYKPKDMHRSILQFLIRLIKTPHFSRFRPTWDKLKRHFDYPKWQRLQTRSPTQRLPHHPLISVILPTYNTPSALLKAAIESVIDQSYPDWELCIADDASTEPHVRELLTQYPDQDDRIKVTFRSENGHISACSNSALALATGEFVALLDHDDLLSPDALYEVAALINQHPEADLIYSDEDMINSRGRRIKPVFKPDWCPDSFLSRMYTCHLGVYRRSLLTRISGFRVGYEGSQDYDLVLRFAEHTPHIFHIPKILYHWRIHPTSSATNTTAKPYAYEAGRKAIHDAIHRRNEPGQVLETPGYPGLYTVRYEISDPKPVSIIIPTRDLAPMLDRCLMSITQFTTYPHYEIILIDNGSQEPSTFKLFDRWQEKLGDRLRILPLDIPFNYPRLNNYGVQQSKSEYLLFLNNDTEIISPDWITGMVEQAQRSSIGAVGARLLYPDNTIQHAGIIAGIRGGVGHGHRYYPSTATGYMNQIKTVSNYSAVTAACLMCRRDLFNAVGGFDESFAVDGNDVDLCFKFLDAGYRNIYLPHVTLYHHESKSRGYNDTVEKRSRGREERDRLTRKWRLVIDHDPCYSPNLSRQDGNYSLRIE